MIAPVARWSSRAPRFATAFPGILSTAAERLRYLSSSRSDATSRISPEIDTTRLVIIPL